MCDSGFSLVSASSEGVATDCPHIGGGGGYTLDTCKQKTCEDNGNVFNFLPDGQCYYKLCADTSDIIINCYNDNNLPIFYGYCVLPIYIDGS